MSADFMDPIRHRLALPRNDEDPYQIGPSGRELDALVAEKVMGWRALPPTFVEFASIARLSRDMVVTEKIDGTNAQVHITDDGRVFAGSRNRWITPEQDNFGFARWVKEHEDQLHALGPGSHYGEWWGSGIQRRYGLSEKRFSLFNVSRWHPVDPSEHDYRCIECAVCHVVPILDQYTFCTQRIDAALAHLASSGSAAAPGFMQPEGVVIYHAASKTLFKKTLDKNDGHKSPRASHGTP